MVTRKWFSFQYNEHAYPYIFAKIFLNSVCQICPSLHLSSSLLLDCVLNQCFIYSSALEKYRAKSLNDKLSDLLRCISVTGFGKRDLIAHLKKIELLLP